MLLTFLTLLTAVNAQIILPIISDPTYHLIPAETLVRTQLSAWGITVGPLSLDLQNGLNIGLHLRRRSACRRASDCSDSRLAVVQEYLDELLAAGWDGSSDIDFTLPDFAGLTLDFDAFDLLKRETEDRGLRLPIIGDVTLGLSASLDIGTKKGWGQAENVAKGERGDTEWFTYVSVGTPPQSLPILPDTGSSDMFVYAQECSTCYTANHSSFDPLASSSYTNSSHRFALEYADGSGASGYIGSDTVSFGAGSGVTAEIVLGLATAAHGRTFRDSGRSGIMGLGQDGMTSLPGGSTLFSLLTQSGQIDEKILSLRLEKGVNRQGAMMREGGGSYLFGVIEDEYIRGGTAGLSWVKTTSDNYWGFGMTDIMMGFRSALLGDSNTPQRAIIDSGTSLIITSDQAAVSIHTYISRSFQAKSGVWYVPCTISSPTVPNLFFVIGGRRYGVPIADLAWKASTSIPDMCISGVQGGMPYFTVLGDLFIKNHYVVLSYEGDEPQVGLGDRRDVPLIL